ncbi:MAG TPA: carboxypeptidase regulatory-like domain-containing protein [Roseiflexaceae bacterium]|nr:carboxypeptidase regulatory-like domain-containing protein [Roseiflexaceae bacterium]
MPRYLRSRRAWLALAGLAIVVALGFLATSDNAAIWPVRNTLLYRAARWWESNVGPSRSEGAGALYGCVRDADGHELARAMVSAAQRDGALHQATAGADGCYELAGLPAGRYVPIVSAPGYDDAAIRSWGLPVQVGAGGRTRLDATLEPLSLPVVSPGAKLRIGEPITLTWALPRPGLAVRREISYDSGGRPNQLTYLYTPIDAGASQLPTLLAVYPGAADTWEGVSIPLAAAGYAVIAVGPAYALDLGDDIAELQRLVAFARAGALPGVDARRMAALGGSYSSLHVQALLERDSGFRAVLLLGGISDIFDMRRRFEQGSFIPPFGLDQALIALGAPNISPERYWRYSSRFHLRRGLPPVLLMHSRDDEIVPFQQSEQLAADLARLDVPHEAYFFDGLSHYLLADRPSAELTNLYDTTLAFLRRTV